MHELSMARAIVAEVTTALADRAEPVVEVLRLRVGRLSGIDPQALAFGFEFASAGTICEGATLEIASVPVRIGCATCDTERETAGAHVLCPVCDRPSADVRAGRDLTIASVDLADEQREVAA